MIKTSNPAIYIGSLSKLALEVLSKRYITRSTPQVEVAVGENVGASLKWSRLIKHCDHNFVPKEDVTYTSNEMDRDRMSFEKHSRDPPSEIHHDLPFNVKIRRGYRETTW